MGFQDALGMTLGPALAMCCSGCLGACAFAACVQYFQGVAVIFDSHRACLQAYLFGPADHLHHCPVWFSKKTMQAQGFQFPSELHGIHTFLEAMEGRQSWKNTYYTEK